MSTAYACSRSPLASTLAAVGSSSTTRILIGSSVRRAGQLQTLRDLLLDLSRVAARLIVREAGAAKGVLPLPIRDVRQPVAGPADVRRRDGRDDVAIDAPIRERHVAIVDTLDEALRFESRQVVTGALAEAANPEQPKHRR